MVKKVIEVEKRIKGGYTAYYLVTKWYILGLLVYKAEERKE